MDSLNENELKLSPKSILLSLNLLDQDVTSTESLPAANSSAAPHVQLCLPLTKVDLSGYGLFSSHLKQQELIQRLLSSECAAERAETKILIVEDNLVNVKVVKQCLSKSDFTHVTVAMNGQLAVDETQRNKYDLILMDLDMPIKNGVTAATEINQDSLNPNCHTPIIALSANPINVAQDQCAKAGMLLYLAKPLVPSHLMYCIAALPPFQFYPLVYCPYILK